jgi:hypothetical protein
VRCAECGTIDERADGSRAYRSDLPPEAEAEDPSGADVPAVGGLLRRVRGWRVRRRLLGLVAASSRCARTAPRASSIPRADFVSPHMFTTHSSRILGSAVDYDDMNALAALAGRRETYQPTSAR